ncbi:MAG: cation diffusion facilitator family transporter [Gemmataceae bacterium]
MTNPSEIRAFRISGVGFLIISILGFVFAILTHSQAIMLDGVYALVSVVMTLLAAQVARLVEGPASQRFHFGHAHFEPLLNLIRGLLIFVICAYALVVTIQVLLHGGREIHAEIAIYYTAISAVWSIGVFVYQSRVARKIGSPALAVDARTWLVDGSLYLGETVGFIVYLLLQSTSLAPLLKYADPIFVIIVVGLLMRVPIKTIREAVREVLHRAPPAEMQHEVRQRLAKALAGLPVRKTHARMVEVGRFFFVLVHVVVDEGFGSRPIVELDQIRRNAEQSLRELHDRVVLDIVFTAEEYWATDSNVENSTTLPKKVLP